MRIRTPMFRVIQFLLRKSDKNIVNQLQCLNTNIFPQKIIQERSSSFIPYYLKYGKDFFRLLIQQISIFEDKYIILSEKDKL